MLRRLMIFIILAVFLFTTAGCGGKSDKENGDSADAGKDSKDEVITIKVADSFPTEHYLSGVAQHFNSKLEEYGEGKVKVEYYPAQQLGKMKDLLDLCGEGVADIVYVSVPFFSGKMPLNSVMNLPEYTTATQGTNIYWDILKEDLFKDEFLEYGVRPVFAYTTPQYDVGTTKVPVRSLEDLKGLKLKSSGGTFEMIHEETGAIPQTISSNECYEAMQRGVIDGNFQSYPSMRGYRLDEIQNYCTYGASFGGYNIAYAINEEKWQSLPEDVKEAIRKAGDDTVKYAGPHIDELQAQYLEEFEEQGMEIYRLSNEDQKQWREAISGVNEKWVANMNDRGVPAQDALDIFQKVCAEYVK